MTPAAAIAALNRQLALHGQDAVLRRSTWVGTTKTNFDVDRQDHAAWLSSG